MAVARLARIRPRRAQRWQLAEKAKTIGRCRCLGTVVTPDTLLHERIRLGLVRYWVMVVIDIGTRRVHIAGVTDQSSGVWMKQIARELTDCMDSFLKQIRHLSLDRDPLYTKAFRTMLRDAGVEMVRREWVGGLLKYYNRAA